MARLVHVWLDGKIRDIRGEADGRPGRSKRGLQRCDYGSGRGFYRILNQGRFDKNTVPVVKRARQTPYQNQCVLIGCLVFLKWACKAYRLCVGEPLRIAKTKMRMIDHNEVATPNVFCK